MGALEFDGLVIETNSTFSTAMTYYNPDGVTPINLTSYTAKMAVKDSAGTQLIELTTSNGYIVLGGSAGTITLTIPESITAGLAAGLYRYDLVLINGSTWTRLLSGSIPVVAGITTV